jgi:hypothetical protein
MTSQISGDSASRADPDAAIRPPLADFAPLHDQLRDPGKVILKAVPNIPNFSPTRAVGSGGP